jgi:hypothetical protein
MTSKADFQALADMHATDAQHLYASGRNTNAYHLSGLSIECALKALICDRFLAGVLPDKRVVEAVYKHDLDGLVGLAGVKADLQTKIRADADFAARWTTVKSWSVASRYETMSAVDAAELIEAAFGKGGLLEWIKTYW